MRPVLCFVIDRTRVGGEDRLVACVRDAAAAGMHLVQLREKDLEAADLYRLTERCLEAVRGTRTRVLVNDRLDVALAAGAHGVHLPASGLPAARVRAIAPTGFLIGRSVHDRAGAVEAAQAGGLDFLVFGTVFPSASKPGAPAAGVEALSSVAAAVPLPVLAIGGVTLERARALAGSGAAGLAAIGLFADAALDGVARLRAIVGGLSQAFDTPESVP